MISLPAVCRTISYVDGSRQRMLFEEENKTSKRLNPYQFFTFSAMYVYQMTPEVSLVYRIFFLLGGIINTNVYEKLTNVVMWCVLCLV